MMSAPTRDDLRSACKGSFAAQIVEEAIACYEAQAYRASIVTIWTAVIYDCIGKLQELDGLGVGWATQLKKLFGQIVGTNDTNAALKFERDVLEEAKKNGLISEIGYKDLERLHEDRHRCAHPSMHRKDEIYQPRSSQALAHIESAIHHLIGQSVLGKGEAITNFLKEMIDEPLFPVDVDEAKARLQVPCFINPTEKLVRDIVHHMLGFILPDSAFRVVPKRYYAALHATILIHQQSFRDIIKEALAKRIRGIELDRYCHVITLLYQIPEVWDLVEEDIQTAIIRFVAGTPSEYTLDLRTAFAVPPLQGAARRRVNITTDIQDLLTLTDKSFSPPPVVLEDCVIDKAVELYVNTSRDDQVCDNSLFIQSIVSSLKPYHVKSILEGIGRNMHLHFFDHHARVFDVLKKRGLV